MPLDFTNVDNFALRYITMEYCYSHAFIMTKMIIIESRRYEAPHDELWPVAVECICAKPFTAQMGWILSTLIVIYLLMSFVMMVIACRVLWKIFGMKVLLRARDI